MANFGACDAGVATGRDHGHGNEGSGRGQRECRGPGGPGVSKGCREGAILAMPARLHSPNRGPQSQEWGGHTEFQMGLTCLLTNHSVFMLLKPFFEFTES